MGFMEELPEITEVSEDTMIPCSVDGVNVNKISAANLGGLGGEGLEYWKEETDRIYRYLPLEAGGGGGEAEDHHMEFNEKHYNMGTRNENGNIEWDTGGVSNGNRAAAVVTDAELYRSIDISVNDVHTSNVGNDAFDRSDPNTPWFVNIGPTGNGPVDQQHWEGYTFNGGASDNDQTFEPSQKYIYSCRFKVNAYGYPIHATLAGGGPGEETRTGVRSDNGYSGIPAMIDGEVIDGYVRATFVCYYKQTGEEVYPPRVSPTFDMERPVISTWDISQSDLYLRTKAELLAEMNDWSDEVNNDPDNPYGVRDVDVEIDPSLVKELNCWAIITFLGQESPYRYEEFNYKGVTTTNLEAFPVSNPIIIDGVQYPPRPDDVVVYNNKLYWYVYGTLSPEIANTYYWREIPRPGVCDCGVSCANTNTKLISGSNDVFFSNQYNFNCQDYFPTNDVAFRPMSIVVDVGEDTERDGNKNRNYWRVAFLVYDGEARDDMNGAYIKDDILFPDGIQEVNFGAVPKHWAYHDRSEPEYVLNSHNVYSLTPESQRKYYDNARELAKQLLSMLNLTSFSAGGWIRNSGLGDYNYLYSHIGNGYDGPTQYNKSILDMSLARDNETEYGILKFGEIDANKEIDESGIERFVSYAKLNYGYFENLYLNSKQLSSIFQPILTAGSGITIRPEKQSDGSYKTIISSSGGGGGGGGSTVEVTQVNKNLDSNKIATITVDGVDTDIYAPKAELEVSTNGNVTTLTLWEKYGERGGTRQQVGQFIVPSNAKYLLPAFDRYTQANKILKTTNTGNYILDDLPSNSLPLVTSSDEGKALVVDSNGDWVAGVPDVPDELPAVTSSDNNKVLKVISGAWAAGNAPTELPAVSTADNGSILKVIGGEWMTGSETEELPNVSSSDNGKVLKVVNGMWLASTEAGGAPDTPTLPLSLSTIYSTSYIQPAGTSGNVYDNYAPHRLYSTPPLALNAKHTYYIDATLKLVSATNVNAGDTIRLAVWPIIDFHSTGKLYDPRDAGLDISSKFTPSIQNLDKEVEIVNGEANIHLSGHINTYCDSADATTYAFCFIAIINSTNSAPPALGNAYFDYYVKEE